MPAPGTTLRAAAALALTALAAACGRPAEGEGEPVRLTLSAAASLHEVMAELADRFEAEHPGMEVRVNVGASGALRQQVERGARVDVFVAAAEGPMDALDARGLIDPETRAPFAANELVLVVPAGDGPAVQGWADLATPAARRVALGAPASVPAGDYAVEVLRALRLYGAIEGKAVYAQNARQVLAYVESGNVDAGVVYATDGAGSDGVRVVAQAPPGTHRPIVYPLAVVRATRHPREAGALARFLVGAEAHEALRRHGFRLPAPAAP